MLKELDSVVLLTDLLAHRLRAGDLGTIVLVHGNKGYEVEFISLTGDTVAVATLAADQVRPANKGEIAHVRALQAAS